MAIATILEFIRKGKKLAEDFPQLQPDVYSAFTSNTIRRYLPFKFQDQLNDHIGALQMTEKDKLEKIKDFLELKKVSAQQQCQVTGGLEQENRRSSSRVHFHDDPRAW